MDNKNLKDEFEYHEDFDAEYSIIADRLTALDNIEIPPELSFKIHQALVIEGEKIRKEISEKEKLQIRKNRFFVKLSAVAAICTLGLISFFMSNNAGQIGIIPDSEKKLDEFSVSEIRQGDETESDNDRNTDVDTAKILEEDAETGLNSSEANQEKKQPESTPSETVTSRKSGTSAANNTKQTAKATVENENKLMLGAPAEQSNDVKVNIYEVNLPENYNKIFLKLYGKDYQIKSCQYNEAEELFIVQVDITKENLTETLIYYGQDGMVWKKE